MAEKPRSTKAKSSTGDRKKNEKTAQQFAAAQEQEVHRTIGRFVAEFSQVEFSLRHLISIRIGLAEPYFDAVMGWWDFSKLCQTLKALYEVDLVDHPKKLKARLKVINAVMALNSERVNVVHSIWTPSLKGWSARRSTAGNAKPKFHYEDIRKLSDLSDQAQRLIIDLYEL